MDFEILLSNGAFIRLTAVDEGTLVELFDQKDSKLIADGFILRRETEQAIQVIKGE